MTSYANIGMEDSLRTRATACHVATKDMSMPNLIVIILLVVIFILVGMAWYWTHSHKNGSGASIIPNETNVKNAGYMEIVALVLLVGTILTGAWALIASNKAKSACAYSDVIV